MTRPTVEEWDKTTKELQSVEQRVRDAHVQGEMDRYRDELRDELFEARRRYDELCRRSEAEQE